MIKNIARAGAVAAAGLLLTVGVTLPASAAPQDAQAVVVVQNENINRWLVVIGGNNYRHDIAPRAKANVLGGSQSRKVWVVAGCTLEKDGKFFDSSPSSGGHYRNFGFQVTEADFFHYC